MVLVGGYVALFRVLQINERVREYLVRRISSELKVDISVSSLSFSPWRVGFNGVNMNIPGVPLTFEAKSIQIGFRFSRLLKSGFRPAPGAEELFVDTPRFIWALSDSDSVSSSGFTLKAFPELPVRMLPRFLMNVNNGAVVVSRNGSRLLVADRVSGWFDAREDQGNLRIEARVLSTGMNAGCNGSFNRTGNSFDANLDISGFDLGREALDVLTGSIRTESGTADFHLRLDQKRGAVRIEGSFGVNDASFYLKDTDIRMHDISLSGRITEKDITLDSASGIYRGMTPRMAGNLTLFPAPVLSVTAVADTVDLSELFRVFSPARKDIPSGTARFEASVSGPLRNPVIRAKFSSHAIVFRGITASDVRAGMRIERGLLTLEQAAATVRGYRIQCGGDLTQTQRSDIRSFTLSVSAMDMQNRGRAYSLILAGEADFRKGSASARYGFEDKHAQVYPLAKFGGTVVLEKNRLTFSCANETLTLSGELGDVFTVPKLTSHVKVTSFPVHEITGVKETTIVLDGECDITGGRESGTMKAEIDLKLGDKVTAHIGGKSVMESPFTGRRALKADAIISTIKVQHAPPMTITVSVRSDSTMTALYANEEGGRARLSARSNAIHNSLSGSLKLADFPLEYIIGIFERDVRNYHGVLDGTVTFAGTLEKPEFFTPEPIHADSLKLAGVEHFSGTGRVSGTTGMLRFEGFELKRKGIPVAHADGEWTSGAPFVLNASGKNVELTAIDDIISRDRITNGRADYSIRMVFTRASGTVDGTFSVTDGHFLDVPFDRASGEFGGGSQGFGVTGFRVEKKDIFTGTGTASSGYFWKDATPNPGLKLDLTLTGKLTRAIPHIVPMVIKKADGDCSLSIMLGGTWQEPVVVGGRFVARHASVEPTFFIDKVDDINATLVIDPDLTTPSGYKAVRIEEANALVLNRRLTASNIFTGEAGWERIRHPALTHVINSDIGLDFGVFVARLDIQRARDRSFDLHIPGFMKPGETCRFEIAGQNRGEFVVGASPFDDKLTPYIAGSVKVLSGDVTFPLLVDPNQPQRDSHVLEEILWNMKISAGSSVYYVSESARKGRDAKGYRVPYLNIPIPVAGATLARTAVKVDEESVFSVTGRLADETFRVVGQAKSSSGTVTYVGVEFEIETIELDLDTQRLEKPAFLTARAKTTVQDDSTGVDTVIYVKVNAVDRTTGKTRAALGRADAPGDTYTELSSELTTVIDAEELGFGYLSLEFSSSNPADNTRDKILARLGLSPDNLGSAATRALAFGMDNYYLDLVRPLEHAIRKYTRLDVVRFTPSVIGNLVRSKIVFFDRFGPDTDYMLFDGSRVMLGEYFLESFFLSYKGQYGVGRDFLRRKERGFYHEIGLQYLMKRNTRLQMNYDYDDIIRESDKRLEIRHDFQF